MALDLVAAMADSTTKRDTGCRDTISYNVSIAVCQNGGAWQMVLSLQIAESTSPHHTMNCDADQRVPEVHRMTDGTWPLGRDGGENYAAHHRHLQRRDQRFKIGAV